MNVSHHFSNTAENEFAYNNPAGPTHSPLLQIILMPVMSLIPWGRLMNRLWPICWKMGMLSQSRMRQHRSQAMRGSRWNGRFR